MLLSKGAKMLVNETERQLKFAVKDITESIGEISESFKQKPDGFLLGEAYAYIECLEILLIILKRDNSIVMEYEKLFGIR